MLPGAGRAARGVGSGIRCNEQTYTYSATWIQAQPGSQGPSTGISNTQNRPDEKQMLVIILYVFWIVTTRLKANIWNLTWKQIFHRAEVL